MSLDIFSWNVRGFNISSHRSGFKKWFKLNQPILGSIIESHVRQPKCSKMISSVLPGWFYETNYDFSELGKIWVLWHPSVRVSILSKSLQMMTCEVKFPKVQSEFVISFVYAENEELPRRDLWSELATLASSPHVVDKPWAVLGDFNQVLSSSEHSTAAEFSSTRGMRDFCACLSSSSLADLTFRGNSFT